jgi:hypothetical protein
MERTGVSCWKSKRNWRSSLLMKRGISQALFKRRRLLLLTLKLLDGQPR